MSDHSFGEVYGIRCRLSTCCIWASLISLPVISVMGQAPAPSAPKKPASVADLNVEKRFNVFELKHSDASYLKDRIEVLLVEFDRTATILEDIHNNRLIVRADANAMSAIEALLKVLDIPREKRPEEQRATKFLRFQMEPDAAAESVMKLFLSHHGRLSIDSARNLVVVQDTVDAVEKFERSLEEYELVRRANTFQGDAKVRLVWLINGVRDGDLAQPPKDLQGVITELATIGVTDLRLAAQAIVKTTGDRQFEIKCSPYVGNPCEFEVQGVLISKLGEINGLNIRLTATEKVPLPDGAPGQVAELKRLCNLDATVRAPLGHTVVLGVAPTEKKTSVFVVQVSASE